MESSDRTRHTERRPLAARVERAEAYAPGDRSPYSSGDRSLGELFSELTGGMSNLIRQEIQLAKTEVSEKASTAGRNVGYIAAGGFIAYVGVFALVAGLILLLGLVIPYWLSALIIGAVIALIGGILVQKGLKTLQEESFAPERTVKTIQEDKEWLKEEAKDVRR